MKNKQWLMMLLIFFMSALTGYGGVKMFWGNKLSGREDFNLGVEDYQRGEYEIAIAHFNDAISINQKYIDAYLYRGLTFEQLGEYEQAVADHGKTIELNPKESLTYFNRGRVYQLLGSYEEAISDFNQAIYLDPDYADVYSSRALVYNTLGEFGRAIADLDRAIALYESQGNSTMLQSSKKLRLQLQKTIDSY